MKTLLLFGTFAITVAISCSDPSSVKSNKPTTDTLTSKLDSDSSQPNNGITQRITPSLWVETTEPGQ